MPFAIDEKATRKMMTWNTSRKDELAPDPLPEGWLGTVGGGLPMKQIPHWEFPIVLYLHPTRPFREIEHRDANFALVATERVATEHLARSINCAAHVSGGPASCPDCKAQLDAAVAEGWTRTPYIPAAPEKPDSDLYGGPRKKK
jgi:hypothetical protein